MMRLLGKHFSGHTNEKLGESSIFFILEAYFLWMYLSGGFGIPSFVLFWLLTNCHRLWVFQFICGKEITRSSVTFAATLIELKKATLEAK